MIEQLIDARRRSLGGFDVGRVLPFAQRRSVGPFVFLDHMGPVDFPKGLPRQVDVRPHPHIGLSTLSYLFRGEMTHRDSLGTLADIRPGEVNWMTAGRGITHSERFERARREGGTLDGVQAWVALPAEDEECAPAFDHFEADALPRLEDAGASGRLIAGAAHGERSPVPVRSPLVYLHWSLRAGARVALPDATERAAYVADGEIEVSGTRVGAGRMVVFTPGRPATFVALAPSVVMVLGGEPLGMRHIEWNFVSSRRERIEQAKADWRAGRFALPPDDAQEFIPLPEDPPPPANPMS